MIGFQPVHVRKKKRVLPIQGINPCVNGPWLSNIQVFELLEHMFVIVVDHGTKRKGGIFDCTNQEDVELGRKFPHSLLKHHYHPSMYQSNIIRLILC